MYLMNFLFDFNNANGLFENSASLAAGDELQLSSQWLKRRNNNPPHSAPWPTPYDPDADPADWEGVGDMEKSPLIVPVAPVSEAGITLRIAHHPNKIFAFNDPEIQVAVCFGRPLPTTPLRASPFQRGSEKTHDLEIDTTFIKTGKPTRRNAYWVPAGTAAMKCPVWSYHIGLVHDDSKVKNGSKHEANRFQFSVGVVITDQNITRHYSQDPEMDVTT